MSEQEKKSGGGAEGSSVVLVEQSATSRHKQPFRPTELKEEAPDLQHKRSRAPAVPSVDEELKDIANSETKGRRESERDISTEKKKHSMAKKLPATAKRRESSPESITLQQLEVDTKRGTVTPLQPIPAHVSAVASASSDLAVEKAVADRKEDEDSITDEVAELRIPEVDKKASEWDGYHDKRKVSWHVIELQEKVKPLEIGARSRACVLERKSSIGPCFRSAAPFGRPSGIAICLPNKNAQPAAGEACYSGHKSVINISISKKCLVNKTNTCIENNDREFARNTIPRNNFFGTLKEKLTNMAGKIKDALNN